MLRGLQMRCGSKYTLDPARVASEMLRQVALYGPDKVVDFLANLRGTPGNLWGELALASKNELRQEFAAELKLADAVREIAAKKDHQ